MTINKQEHLFTQLTPPTSLSVTDYMHHLRDDLIADIDEEYRPITPVTVLGIFERVGSNWFLDSVASAFHTHNEPYRQQLHWTHQSSSLTPDFRLLRDTRYEELSSLEQHWFKGYVLGKFGRTPNLVKETNLFFAVDNFVDLFDTSTRIVLTRDPAGIADSFYKRRLFNKWDYEKRFLQITAMAEKDAEFSFINNFSNNNSVIGRLALLLTTNSLLIARALRGQNTHLVPYEACDDERYSILSGLSRIIPGSDRLIDAFQEHERKAPEPRESLIDDTFSTAYRESQSFSTALEKSEVSELYAVIDKLISKAHETLPDSIVMVANEFLTSHRSVYKNKGTNKKQSSQLREPTQKETVAIRNLGAKTYVGDQLDSNLRWRQTLVTNLEFAEFLNFMNSSGIPNVINGVQFLFNENMPAPRGGRIKYDSSRGYTSVEGFEDHPVYWVTWYGAKLFADYVGNRLPTSRELELQYRLTPIDLCSVNSDYRVGDVVAASNKGTPAIQHLIGNLAVWCSDGPRNNIIDKIIQARFFSGIAWNRVANLHTLTENKSRPAIGSSRSIGIRLIEDEEALYRDPIQEANRVLSELQ